MFCARALRSRCPINFFAMIWRCSTDCVGMLPRGVTDAQFYGQISGLLNQYRRNNMSLTSHLQELKKKHDSLSDAVEKAQRSPGSDDLEVSRLKKEKLHLKEEINRLTPA